MGTGGNAWGARGRSQSVLLAYGVQYAVQGESRTGAIGFPLKSELAGLRDVKIATRTVKPAHPRFCPLADS